ncbi:type I polyketide synthase [Umezawaea sp. NPDC059074]|uniref:type I polyketide synthase n=1 Tax=Umezawaea sp. NPDC059074 TaxID=3346716 RepID=UPI0036871EFA
MTDETPYLAVVGMAGRFPGTPDLAGFWAALVEGVDTLTRDHGPAHGLVVDGDKFDAGFFGYAPSEALLIDPQHRVFLQCAWEALEHSGYDPATYPGVIGVYGGSGDTGYAETLRQHRSRFPDVSELQFRIAAGVDFLTSRVSYKLGLTGPAVTVQTACSTSLVAVHTAAQALLAGECDLALAGGITLHVPFPVDEVEDGIISPDGYCRAFDADARGTIASDGAGIVALKRLDDALADGDHVHAVVLGSAVNNDGGGKVGFTAPSVDGQAAAIRAAHLVSGVEAASIGYVEAHGTGTPVGDPIEVRALTKAFGRGGSCVLGSVKATIGHTDAAAGVIGLIKTVLALENELIPATAHYRAPNPLIDFAASPFEVRGTATPWPRGPEPRRAGVNSLGIGGTNAHVVLEEAPVRPAVDPGRPYQVFPLSARSSTALTSVARRLADHLGDEPLADVAWTLQAGRRAFAHRGFVVGGDRDEVVRALGKVTAKVVDGERRAAFLFPGQGGQHVGMARELYAHEPVFRAEFDRCADLVLPELGVDLRTALFGLDTEAGAARLSTMDVGQPAVFSVEYALARLWMSWGVTPSVVAGHSLGAYAAATIAGVLSVPDAVALVLERGRLLGSLPDGAMLAIPLPENEVTPLLGTELSLAALNGPRQCVVAGPVSAVDDLRRRLVEDGVEVRLLRISTAAHSSLVEPVLNGYERRVAGVRLHAPEIPWISDRTGTFVTAEEATDPAFWSAHLRETVRFADTLDTLLRHDDSALVEIGPGRTLTGLARQHPARSADRTVVPTMPHPADETSGPHVLMTAVGTLWQAGVAVDWEAVHEGERRYRTPLPTYPFEGRRFRLDLPDDEPDAVEDVVTSTTPTEAAVAAAFGTILGLREVDVDDDFFDLGGDSLLAARIVALLRRDLGAEVVVRSLFRAPTVAALARLIDGEEP